MSRGSQNLPVAVREQSREKEQGLLTEALKAKVSWPHPSRHAGRQACELERQMALELRPAGPAPYLC